MNMETNRIENNQVTISGEIVSDFEFSHEVYGEKFYITQLEVERKSEITDIVPIMVSERLVDVKADWIGQFVRISGQFRPYNRHEEDRNRLVLSVFVREFDTLSEAVAEVTDDVNKIFLDGFIYKPSAYRKTPLGREIADILLAVNRQYGKSDYIPCIAWGRNARFVSELKIGTRLKVWGRIQSREYQKKISDDEVETRVAYEVSVSKISVAEETEE